MLGLQGLCILSREVEMFIFCTKKNLAGKMSEWEREWLKAAAAARNGREDCQEDVSIDFLTVTYGQLRLVATDCKGTEWILDQGGGALTIGRRDTQVLSCRVTSAM